MSKFWQSLTKLERAERIEDFIENQPVPTQTFEGEEIINLWDGMALDFLKEMLPDYLDAARKEQT